MKIAHDKNIWSRGVQLWGKITKSTFPFPMSILFELYFRHKMAPKKRGTSKIWGEVHLSSHIPHRYLDIKKVRYYTFEDRPPCPLHTASVSFISIVLLQFQIDPYPMTGFQEKLQTDKQAGWQTDRLIGVTQSRQFVFVFIFTSLILARWFIIIVHL